MCNLQILRTIFVNYAQVVHTFSSRFYRFKIISGIPIQFSLPH